MIKQELIDKITSGQCVVFIGAGASAESQAPTASQLALELNEKYLDGKYAYENLDKISSYIEAKMGLGKASAINYIINRLSTLEPSGGHLLLPKFNWASLYTTNYDTLIEKAYLKSNSKYRTIISNSDLYAMFSEKENLQLIYKPHGCITRPDSIILTEDDYYNYSENRTAIFRQLENHRYRNSFLFIGYSFSDFNLSKIWYDIRKETGTFTQWSYALWPNCTEDQKSLWRSRNVILIDAKFGEFMSELYESISTRKNNISNEIVNDSNAEVIKSLLLCLEAKDSYYKTHSLFTSHVASEIAEELRLDTKTQINIKNAAILHDIGVIKIPDNILFKPEMLTVSDFELIKQHTILGEKITSSLASIRPLAGIIRHHHEQFDGSGYPDGIQRDKIPIESRVIAIADAFCSMCIRRPFRQPLCVEAAIKEINLGSGHRFDPQVVNAFSEVYRKGLINKRTNE